MGCAVALWVSRCNGTTAIAAVVLGIGGFVLGTLIFVKQGGWFPSDWDRMLIYGPSSALLVAGVVARERMQGRSILHPLSGLGDTSYSLYLSHLPVIAVAGLLWRRLLPASLPAAHLAALTATFIIALVAGFASFRLIEAPLLRLSRNPPGGLVPAKVIGSSARNPGLQAGEG
jgi:exopolysaccharide production protein ExoZ